jgi:hypothetical protein
MSTENGDTAESREGRELVCAEDGLGRAEGAAEPQLVRRQAAAIMDQSGAYYTDPSF